MTKLSLVLVLTLLLLNQVHSESMWCISQKGGKCKGSLPGVYPTYACGVARDCDYYKYVYSVTSCFLKHKES